MKKILIATLVGVMAFSVVTLGGWKLGAEQGVDVVGASYPLTAYVGWDFDAPFIDTSPVSISGDFVVTRSYNWPAVGLSGLLSFDGELVFTYVDDFDVVFWTSADIDYTPLPYAISLNALEFGTDVIGYINDVLTLRAGVNFAFVPGPGFETGFYVGFDAEW